MKTLKRIALISLCLTVLSLPVGAGATSAAPATPVVKSAANGNGYVKVVWGKVTNASGYYVYRKTSGTSWARIATLKVNSTVSYADKTVKSGTAYRYTVRAYVGSTLSGYSSTGVVIRYLSTPMLKGVKNTASGPTVSWTKVTGASGYYVYRKTSSTAWAKVGTVKSGATVSFANTTAKDATTYSYMVRAYNGSYMSSYNATGLTIKAIMYVYYTPGGACYHLLTCPTIKKSKTITKGTVSAAKKAGKRACKDCKPPQ